jgi:hypothetical protein
LILTLIIEIAAAIVIRAQTGIAAAPRAGAAAGQAGKELADFVQVGPDEIA